MVFVFSFIAFIVIGSKGAKAASCSASTATVTKTSSPAFYIDNDPNETLPNAYTSYQVTTGASGNFKDLWVKVDSFTDTTKLGLAPSEDGLYHVGALSQNSTAYVYFYFKGAETTSAQSYTLRLYEGKPGVNGIENCSSSQSNTSVTVVSFASSNKVNTITYGAPTLGGTFTVNVRGDTGQIGNSQIFSYTPATLDSWNADCLELKDTQIVLTGGNTGTYSHDLYRSALNKTDTSYTITYTFVAKCVTASSTTVTPVNYISSGNALRHTSTTSPTYTALPKIAPATNYLIMTKSVNPGGSTAGGNVTYSVDIINNGPSASTLDEIKDILPSSPANVSYITNTTTYDNDIGDAVAASAVTDPVITGQTLDWVKSFSIPSGKTARLTYQATIPSTSGSYVNSATAYTASTQIDTTTSTTDNAPATATYGVGNPSMTSSTKTASDINGGTLQPGDIIEYTITATATGSNNATGVRIADTLDTNTNNLARVIIGASSTNCGNTFSNNSTSTALDITNITINANTSCIITFRATVKANVTNGTTITNTASIVPSNAGAIAGYPSSTPMIVQITPVLSITNTENDADNVVIANQVVTYTITISNTGQTNANGVDLTNTITGPVGSLSAVSLTNCGTSYVDTSAGLSVNIASLSITTSANCVITYTVTVNSGASSGSVTNTADITAAREGGSDPAAVSASTLLIGVVATPPNLSTTITDDDADNIVIPGRVVTYTVGITNSGQTDATTTMAVTIPAGMNTPNTITYTSCGSPTSSYSLGTLSFSNIGVAAGATCTIQFKVPINSPLDEGTTLTVSENVAQASQGGNDPALVNADTLTIDATPILAITITENDADNSVLPSQDVTYTVTVSNTGDGTATGVQLTSAKSGPIGNPSSFGFSGCGASYANNSSTTVSISGLSIAAGGTCTITYHVVVDSNASSGSTITQTADATASTEGGTDSVPVSASTLTVASLPNLAVSISDNDADNTVTPGQVVTYTVTIVNSGGLSATTSMALSIPAQMSGPSSFTYSNCGSPSGGVSVTSISIAAGQTCTITFNATVANPLNEGTTLVVGANVAQASQGGNDPANVNADTLTVDATPALTTTISENDADNLVYQGQDITYTVTIANSGDGAATGVSLIGTPTGPIGNPSSFTFSNCGGSYINSSISSMNIAGISISAGATCTITYHVTINSDADGGATVTQSADASAASEGGSDPLVANASTLTVASLPNLAVNISDSDSDNNVNPGQAITYTVTITNSGQTNATTSMALSIPAQMSGPSSFTYSNCGSPSGGVNVTSISIAAGQTCTITFINTIANPLNEGITLVVGANVAQASQGGNDPANVNADTLSVDATPNLSSSAYAITDINGGTLKPGDVVNYTLTIKNTGDGAATGVDVTGSINSNINMDTNSISYFNCGSSHTSSSSASNLSLHNIEIAVGTDCVITFQGTLKSPINEGTNITETATVDGADQGGISANVQSNTLSTDATPNMSTSYIGVNDINGGNPKPGDKIAYTIHIINSGDGNGSGINLTSALSQYLNIATGSFTFENCGNNYSNNSNSKNLSFTNLSVGTSNECTIYFEAFLESPINEGTQVFFGTNISSASEGGPGGAPSTEKLIIDSTPILGAVIFNDDEDGTVFLGQGLHSHIEIANFGDGRASGVTAKYRYTGSIGNFISIEFSNCGGGAAYEEVSGGYDFKNLEITTTNNCVIQFNYKVDNDATGGSKIDQSVDVTAASEGGVKPDISNDTTLTVNAVNHAPNIPGSVITSIFSGGNFLNDSALAGAQLSSNLTDPDDNDQVRYRIQIATDSLFNNVVIDYRSTYSAEGNRTYTYRETTGTYLKGGSDTVLGDGPYYVQLRAEDISGANSNWYRIDGVAFNYDNTPPAKPEKPYTVGEVKDGNMNIGWDVTQDSNPDSVLPYRLEYSDTPDFANYYAIDTSERNAYFSNVTPGSYKYFRILWRDKAGNLSEPSDILAVKMPEVGGSGGVAPTDNPINQNTNMSPKNYPALPPVQNVTSDAPKSSTEPSKVTVQNINVILLITDSRGSPVENAKVVLVGKDGVEREGRTGKDGIVIFENVPLGDYKAKIQYKNYYAETKLKAEWGIQRLFVRVSLNTGTANWTWMYVMLLFIFTYIIWLDLVRHYSIWPILLHPVPKNRR